MDDADPEVENFARTAWLASEFLSLLRAAGVPDGLSQDMVRDWHYSLLDEEIVWADLTDDDDS